MLKPNVEDTLKADLSFVLIVSKVLQFLNPELSRTSLVDIVGDIRESMLEETDFRKEAQNVDAFRRYLEDAELTNIAKAPQVYKQFSGKRVMVMEYFSGVPLTDLEAIRSVRARAIPRRRSSTRSTFGLAACWRARVFTPTCTRVI